MIKTYNKNKSFLKFHSLEKQNEKEALESLKIILNDKSKLKSLNKYQLSILDLVKKDLFTEKNKNSPKFQLSPNVINELKVIDKKEIPKYLFHRYRYEIFPQTYTADKYPPYLQIEPTSFCNYRCVFCYQTNKDFTTKSNGYMGHMKIEMFKLIVDQAENNIEFISLASRGEPLVSPVIEKMLEYTRGKFLSLKINTNASVLTEKKCHAILQGGVQTIVFSADAADAELYKKLRVNGKLEKVVANIRMFKKIREKHYPKAKIITRVSGVKVSDQQNFKDMENFWSEMVDQVAFVDYCQWENVYKMKENKLSAPCSDLWRRMFVWWDGKTNPCDVDYLSSLSPGYLKKDYNLSQLWKSKLYESLRTKHTLKSRKKINPCNRCTVV
tara:strand:+ start:441 stop:1592 length:1152 start_codon:yes stop_codon:yes gene_type:complete